MDTWTAVTATAAGELEDALASFLIDCGAPGIETSAHGAAIEITAHFPGRAPLERIERFCDLLPEIFPGLGRPQLRTRRVQGEDWAENWKAHFPPLAIGERLYVHPPWCRDVPATRLGIEIDPGMAFGTGHHPSTRGCLRLLEIALRERASSRVLDVGTGSGILAIAAAKLGGEEIWAIDVDGEACRIAAENAERNEVRLRIAAGLDAVPGSFDVIVANLFAAQLVSLAPKLAALLHPGGLAIGSGILWEEAAKVEAAWRAAGLEPRAEQTEEDWTTVGFVRTAAR